MRGFLLKKLPKSISILLKKTGRKPKVFKGRLDTYWALNDLKMRKQQVRGKQVDKQELFMVLVEAVHCGIKIKTFRDTEEMLYYNDELGIWELGAELIVKEILHKIDSNLTSDNIREIIDKVQRETYEFRENFNLRNCISVQNGVIDLETLKLSKHSPENLITRGLDVYYDPDGECPFIDRFLGEIIPEKRDVIEEMMAYCLVPNYNYHKVFMFIGEGANGKSTLLELLTIFLGQKNVSHVPLQAFETSPFSVAALYGKMANVFSDLPPKALYSTGIIKTLSGGDSLSADVKHKDRINFRNYAKLIYSMNKIPMIKFDDTTALWRRFVIFKFKRKFLGKKADPDLLAKLSTPDELSGLLSLLLLSLKRLNDRGFFIGDDAILEARQDYILSSDSVHSFALWGLEESTGNRLTNSELFETYLEFCEFHSLEPQHQQTLSKNLPLHLPKIKRWKGKKGRGYAGIRMKEDFTIEEEEEVRGTAKTAKTGQGVNILLNENGSKKETHNAVPPVPAVPLRNPNPKNYSETTVNQIIAFMIRKEFLRENNESLTREQLIKLVNIDFEFNDNNISKCIDKLFAEGLLFMPKDDSYKWVS